jgi:tRNA(Ile)-lysidine synthase
MNALISGKSLIASVEALIVRHEMIEPGSGVLCGISGGPDSVAMLFILNDLKSELDFRLSVAHLDHALRPESARDAEFVRELADGLGVESRAKRVDVRSFAARKKISVEEAGRKARYSFFEEQRIAVGALSIATGHQRNDSLETFFLRVFRGSTLTGLGGIAPIRGRIIRPLIESGREEIVGFLRENNIPFLNDPTNLNSDTDRNFVRNQLIPTICRRFPDFEAPLERTMDLVRQEELFLDGLSKDAYARTLTHEEPGEIVVIAGLSREPDVIAARVLLAALFKLSGPGVRWGRSHLDAVMKVLRGTNPSARLDLASGIKVSREYDRLVLSAEDPHIPPEESEIVVHAPGEVTVPAAKSVMEFRIVDRISDSVPIPEGLTSTVFDADEIPFPLHVRSPRPGDRFSPWGMQGTRKLKKLLIDLKIPAKERHKIPILVKGDEILWIPHIRRGRAAPVTERTRRLLEVSVKRRLNANAS